MQTNKNEAHKNPQVNEFEFKLRKERANVDAYNCREEHEERKIQICRNWSKPK